MLTRYVLLDLEAVALDDAAQWLPTVEAPGNYTKADSIAAYVKAETERQLLRAPLDPDLCRIAVVGMQPWDGDGFVRIVLTETDERAALARVWQTITATCPMVGYGLTWYDIGVLVRRSQLLGVRVPAVVYKQGKYRHDLIIELADYLTLNGMIEQKKGRGLDYHCRRLGIQVDDSTTGADVAGLWASSEYELVGKHCLADLLRIQRLAERLGVIPEVTEHQPGRTGRNRGVLMAMWLPSESDRGRYDRPIEDDSCQMGISPLCTEEDGGYLWAGKPCCAACLSVVEHEPEPQRPQCEAERVAQMGSRR